MNTLNSNDIQFIEDGHKYLLKSNPDVEFTSCTTFIDYFFEKFDRIGIANNLTATNDKYIGMTPQELVNIWDGQTNRGSQVHKEIEDYLKLGKKPKDIKSKQAIKWINNIDRDRYEIISEAVIYSEEIKIAGTVDLIMIDKRTKMIDLYDWKTTKVIKQNSFEGKMGRKKATSKLMDCNYNHYTLQISLYRYILEKYYGLTVNKLTMLHLNGIDVVTYKLDYMKDVLEEMLKYDRAILAEETEAGLTKEFNDM